LIHHRIVFDSHRPPSLLPSQLPYRRNSRKTAVCDRRQVRVR
jgi:hypothetical protein